MSESAFERSLAEVIFALRESIRRHDRFVVMGLVFSLLPLPPACFVGLLLSVINAWLLGSGRLGRQEMKLVRLSLVFSIVNSVLAAALIIWGYRYFTGLEIGAFTLPGYIMDWLQGVLRSWPSWLRGNGSESVLI